jgi:uncharacterized repeat protein (TIGR01451 family)
MVFALTGPAWSERPAEEQKAADPKSEVAPKAELGVVEVPPGMVPQGAVEREAPQVVSDSPECAALENSPLAEPEWYVDVCLGGVRPEARAAQPGPLRVPGDLFYLHNVRLAGQFPQSVYTSPIPTYNFTLLGANANAIFAMDFDNTATTLWGITNPTAGTKMVGTYNLTTGAFTPTVPLTGIPAANTISSLKFDPTSTTVYVNATSQLYTIDLATGVATLVGNYTHAAPAVIEIAIHPTTGQMYGEDLNDNFYSIDKATGATTLIGPMGVLINFAQGMDFDNSDGTLYQFAYIGGGVNDLRTIDVTTGVSTLVLNGPAGPEHEGAIKTTATPPVVQEPFVDEVEPNDTPGTAQPLSLLPGRVRAKLFRTPFVAGDIDVDVYSFTAPAGARVYATAMTGWSSGSTDPELDIIDVDGTTVLETDDTNGTISATAPSIAGTVLTTGGTYYVRVRQGLLTSLSGTVRPYDLYVALQSGTPTPEVEPNDTVPNPLPPNGWVSGVVDPAADSDVFSLSVNAGDTIVASLDLDPERDAVFANLRLGIGNFNNFFFVTADTPPAGDIPSEALMMTPKTTGTYFIYVQEQVAGVGAPTATYNLSVSVIPAKARTCTTYTGATGPITDLGTTDFTVAVPDAGLVGYLRASVTATHPATADLDVTLISPDNNEVILFDDPGTNASAAAPQINVTLEDEAGIHMSQFTVHSGMHYIPEVGGRMEYFNGMQKQGTWTLRVRDDVTGNTGTLDAFSIEVCDPAPRPACLVPGPQEIPVYSSDFESGDGGFTHAGAQDEWERGLPAFDPILTAHSGTNAWKTDLDSNYENSANNDLISAPLDLTAVTGRITASWWHRFNMESTTFDMYWVEVREVGNPASARRLFDWTGSTMSRGVGNPLVTIRQAAGWAFNQVDISDFAGTNAELRFHLQTDTSVQFTGIAVDDVTVTACTQVVGQQLSDVGITKDDGQGTYYPGEVLTYTIVATNAGPNAVTGALVTDAFPADLTNVTWTCTASSGSACGSPSGSGDIAETVNLLMNGTATFTATATVSMSATDPIVNTATITVPGGWADPNNANNNATDTNVFVGAEPVSLDVDTAGNRVYDPDETAVIAPTWRNTGAGALALTGTLTNHTGPAGATYAIPDGTADYGTIAAGATSSCSSTGDCYSVSNTVTARPSLHWDSTADEAVPPTGATKTWTLHIGGSFADVSTGSAFYRFIETLLHNGVTGGCTATDYCPSTSTTREQMAVFVLVAKEGAGYTPPACTTPIFNDVPAASPFCRFIEELFNRGVVAGCGGGAYCPTASVLRDQMAVFVLRTLDPALDPPACVAGSEMFADLPSTSPFCRWVEELARRGVVTGCGGGNYCPGDPVTREQMGVFLSVTFSLTLYGL